MNEQERAAVELLSLVGKHARLIASAYFNERTFPDDEKGGQIVERLIRARLARRNDEHGEPRLNSALASLIDHGLKNARRLQSGSGLELMLKEIEEKIDSYRAALAANAKDDALELLRTIEEDAGDLVEALHETAQTIWRQVDREFSWITSLEMKIHENKKIIDRVKGLLSALDDLGPLAINQLAGKDPALINIFHRARLSHVMAECRNDISDALDRLSQMLFAFNETRKQGRLIQKLNALYQNSTGYLPGQRLEIGDVAHLLFAEPLPLFGTIDVEDDRQLSLATELLKGLRKTAVGVEMQDDAPPVDAAGGAPAEYMLTETPTHAAVDALFCKAIDEGSVRAMDEYDASRCGCASDVWLHSVIGYREGLDSQKRGLFQLRFDEAPDSNFSGVFNVADIELTFTLP